MASPDDILQNEIARRTARGWEIVSRGENEVQMRYPKRFSFGWAILWFLFFGVGLLVYLIWHWLKSEQLAFIRVVDGRLAVSERRGLLGTLLLPIGAYWQWAGSRGTTRAKALASYSGPVAALLVVVIVIAVAACGGGDEKGEPAAGAQETPTAAAAESPTTAPEEETPEQQETPTPEVREPEPQTVAGTGQEVSPAFALEAGLTVFRMTHDGTSNFAIWLLNQDTGEQLELLANEIGAFDGAKAVGIAEPGNYVLDVTADGRWSADVEQPRPTSAPEPPQTFTSVGQSVPPPFMLNEGLATFRMTHDGSANFAIWLVDANGELIELLVNEIGPFDGSKAVSVTGDIFAASPGIHFLDVAADGNWSVTIEQ